MKFNLLLPALAAIPLLGGCVESSLSGGSSGSGLASAAGYGAVAYTGGASSAAPVSERDIRSALNANRKPLQIPSGSRVLLVQDDATLPDDSLIAAFAPHCTPVPASGRMSSGGSSPEEVRRALRLSAANAGARYIILVTGVFESTTENLATQTVSWVPIAGQFIPDEVEHVRLKLTAVTIDTASGAWNAVPGPSIEDKRLSNYLNRSARRDQQLDKLRQSRWPELARAVFRS